MSTKSLEESRGITISDSTVLATFSTVLAVPPFSMLDVTAAWLVTSLLAMEQR